MRIRPAQVKDLENILSIDKHIAESELKNSIAQSRMYLGETDTDVVGILRYNLFWDNTPFLNLLYIEERFRRRGYGSALLSFWESQMVQSNYNCVMTSTLSTESAQNFYKKHGYKDIGGFTYLDEPYEIIFQKQLKPFVT